ncbi:cell division protein FtsQ/DivIB [Gammaproteobacteria bacterium]|nr:cell division protein FtsQ/DivIB [Gammaproteobacteria bacterium]
MDRPFQIKSGKKRLSKNSRGASVKTVENKDSGKFLKPLVFYKKIAFIAIGLSICVLLASNIENLYQSISSQKIRHVVIEGNLAYVDKTELEGVVFNFTEKSLVGLNLGQIKLELENNPWISSVTIRREWPDTLVVNVVEEVAIARWGEEQLLNQQGKIFSPKTVLNQSYLPYLSGPDGLEQDVMEHYQQINQLLYPQGFKISSLTLNSRSAWTLDLENGVRIKVGKGRVLEKIRRLLTVIDDLFIEQMVDVEFIDLRYSNGIAVGRRAFTADEMVSL